MTQQTTYAFKPIGEASFNELQNHPMLTVRYSFCPKVQFSMMYEKVKKLDQNDLEILLPVEGKQVSKEEIENAVNFALGIKYLWLPSASDSNGEVHKAEFEALQKMHNLLSRLLKYHCNICKDKGWYKKTKEQIYDNKCDCSSQLIGGGRGEKKYCDCQIPKPKSPFSNDEDCKICRDCNNEIPDQL